MSGVDAPRQARGKLDLVEPPRLDVPAVAPDRGRAFGRMWGHLREPLRRERTVEPLGEERDRGVRPWRLEERWVGLPRQPCRMALEGCQSGALGAGRRAADEGRGEEEVGRVIEAGRLEGEDRSLPAVDVGASEDCQERLAGIRPQVGDDFAGENAGHAFPRLGRRQHFHERRERIDARLGKLGDGGRANLRLLAGEGFRGALHPRWRPAPVAGGVAHRIDELRRVGIEGAEMAGEPEERCLIGRIAEIGEKLVAAVAGSADGIEHAAKPRQRRLVGVDVGGADRGVEHLGRCVTLIGGERVDDRLLESIERPRLGRTARPLFAREHRDGPVAAIMVVTLAVVEGKLPFGRRQRTAVWAGLPRPSQAAEKQPRRRHPDQPAPASPQRYGHQPHAIRSSPRCHDAVSPGFTRRQR